MATTTVFSKTQDNNHVVSGIATVDINETATLAIPCGGRSVVRIGVPTITTGTLTFTVTPYPGATARTLKDASGNTVTVASSSGGFVTVIPELSGAYEFTIVCGALQAAERQFQVQMVGLDPVPSGSNEITVEGGSITAAQGTKAAASGAWPEYLVPQTAAAASPSVDVSTAAEDNRVVKASAGALYGFVVNSTTSQYIQIHNKAALPSGGDVPFLTFPIVANTTLTVDFGVYGIWCSTGITIVNSTTQQTYTDGGDDCLFNTQYN